jgi:hypothetical protein
MARQFVVSDDPPAKAFDLLDCLRFVQAAPRSDYGGIRCQSDHEKDQEPFQAQAKAPHCKSPLNGFNHLRSAAIAFDRRLASV